MLIPPKGDPRRVDPAAGQDGPALPPACNELDPEAAAQWVSERRAVLPYLPPRRLPASGWPV